MSPKLSRSAAFLAFALALVFASTLCAQVGPRIVGRPDNSALVRIPGSTHPLVAVAREIGRAPESLPMERMLLQLTSSPEQQAALEQLLADQQDPASPRYHAWLTPEQFGEQFGAVREDIDSITGWLESQGFQVTEVAAGRRSIEFSGTAGQVETAFHTQIHRYEWNGRQHRCTISVPGRSTTSSHLPPLRRRISAAGSMDCRLMTLPPSTTLPLYGPPGTTAPGRASPSLARAIS